jgi:hypothetical protein
MIKEIQMFTVVCDNCGLDVLREHEYSGVDNKDYVENCAMEEGWIKQGDNHYCSDCFDYDKDDNLIIKNK